MSSLLIPSVCIYLFVKEREPVLKRMRAKYIVLHEELSNLTKVLTHWEES